MHWSHEPSHRPDISQHQHEIIVGVLMSDGSIERGSKNPTLSFGMTNEEYLNYLDSVFGVIGTGVKKRDVDNDNWNQLYWWNTRRHPDLSQYEDWYHSGEKVWPPDVELTPTVLKHLYVGDGSWANKNGSNHIRIAMLNESDNTDKVDDMFERAGLPAPMNYSKSDTHCTAIWSVEQSKELWEYMGDPLPGFEDKWPN
jgi:hypothetical protein